MLIPLPDILREINGHLDFKDGELVPTGNIVLTSEQKRALEKYNKDLHAETIIIED